MTDIPCTRSLNEIREVIDSIGQPSNRSSLPRKTVVRVLEDVLLELTLLRADQREWACLSCESRWYRDAAMPSYCPLCEEPLQPVAWCQRKVYDRNIEERNEKIRNLEFALSELMDLDIKDMT